MVEQAFLDGLAELAKPLNKRWFDAFGREWHRHEGGEAWHNPWNTTQPGPAPQSEPPSFVDGRWEWFNSFGDGWHVRNYGTVGDGVRATWETLTNGHYPDIVAALRLCSLNRARDAIAAQVRTWGTMGFADQLAGGWPLYVPPQWHCRPVDGPITSLFGAQDIPEHSAGHSGVDFGVVTGTPVRAPAAGIIVADSYNDVFGYHVIVDAVGTEVYYLLGHLSAESPLTPGDTVRGGEVLGPSGNTGLSTGPHVHWGVSTEPTFSNRAALRDPLAYPVTPEWKPGAMPLPPPTQEGDMTEAQVRAIVRAEVEAATAQTARVNNAVLERLDTLADAIAMVADPDYARFKQHRAAIKEVLS